MLARSASGTSFSSRAMSVLLTGVDSPVRLASWTAKLEVCQTTRLSAGMWSPASSSTRSPGTSSRAGTTRVAPSRRTLDDGAASRRSAARLFSARYSWTRPRMALRMTMARMASGVDPFLEEAGDQGGGDEDPDHEALELVEEDGQGAAALLLLELVGAERPQLLGRGRRGEAGLAVGPEGPDDLFDARCHHFVIFGSLRGSRAFERDIIYGPDGKGNRPGPATSRERRGLLLLFRRQGEGAEIAGLDLAGHQIALDLGLIGQRHVAHAAAEEHGPLESWPLTVPSPAISMPCGRAW